MNPNVFNNSGAVKDLFETLRVKSIHRFNSIDEMIDFKKNYNNEIEKNKKKIAIEILEDIKNLTNENESLRDEYNTRKDELNLHICNQIEQLNSILQSSNSGLFQKIKRYFAKKKLNHLESNFNQLLEEPLKTYLSKIEKCESRITYLMNHQNEEIDKRSKPFIKEMEYIDSELSSLSNLIYGGIGELRAINLLQRLPNQYYIVNDFRASFKPPLYNKRENEKIFSIQLDHIVVGPTGIYVIETKYWNQKSIKSNNLFSPIKQLKRGGFALFVILNDFIRGASIFSNNWGQTQISVSNILLMMNSSTNEQFQFVKILTESNLINYITKRAVVLNKDQIKFILDRIT